MSFSLSSEAREPTGFFFFFFPKCTYALINDSTFILFAMIQAKLISNSQSLINKPTFGNSIIDLFGNLDEISDKFSPH